MSAGSYIGKSPQYGFFEKQRITTANGVLTAFNLAFTTADSAQLLVSVAGVIQEPGQAYTVLSGSPQQISFTEAPANGVDIFIIWMGKELTGPRFSSDMLTDQSALGGVPASGDQFLVYDVDASSLKKVTYANVSAHASGDVVGPGTSTDDALAKFDSTTGKVIQNSNAILTDAGVLTATTFVGNLTGNASGTAATVTGATQSAITALGTIASLVATTADINGGTFEGIVGGTTPGAGTFTQVDITAQGDLRLQDTTGGEYVAIQAPAAVTSWTLTLPTDDGTASQFLQTDGAGVSTWATVITDTSGAWTSGTSTTGKALVMGF